MKDHVAGATHHRCDQYCLDLFDPAAPGAEPMPSPEEVLAGGATDEPAELADEPELAAPAPPTDGNRGRSHLAALPPQSRGTGSRFSEVLVASPLEDLLTEEQDVMRRGSMRGSGVLA